MIRITRLAFRDCGGFTVWRPHRWATPFFRRGFGTTRNKRARLLLNLPFGFGMFFTFGKGWIE